MAMPITPIELKGIPADEIDPLREDAGGDIVFFDIHPSGQFIDTGGALALCPKGAIRVDGEVPITPHNLNGIGADATHLFWNGIHGLHSP